MRRVLPFLALLCAIGLPSLLAPSLARAELGDDSYAKGELFVRVEDGRVHAAIRVKIASGWHLYHRELGPADAVGVPTTVTFGGPELAWSEVRFPEPFKAPQPGLAADGGDTWIYSHKGTIVLRADAPLPDGASPDLVRIRASIEGLTCSEDGSCVPYEETLSLAGPDELFARAATDPPSSETATSTPDQAPGDAVYTVQGQEDADARGLGTWLALAFVAGMILNIMPCVLPVISIKVLSFVQQAGESRGRVLALGSTFALGIVVVFVGLATLAALAGQGWGEQFQSEEFVIGMTILVFAFSLSLFGVYELGAPVPQGGGYARREGLADAFFKGMLATALATPCSGPFLGSTLAWTLAQPTFTIYAIYLSLGVGMAIPYVILTANPALLKLLPRPGRWMETFKQAMGFLLVATVLYLLLSVQEKRLLFLSMAFGFVALGCWWWGRFADYTRGTGRRLVTLATALAIAGAGTWASFGPVQAAFSQATDWESYDEARFERYKAEGRHIFVDFTAEWCPNCKYNERFVYDTKEAQALFEQKNVVKIKADLTHDDAEGRAGKKLRNALGARSIPFMAVFPKGAADRPIVRHDLVGKQDFLSILEALP